MVLRSSKALLLVFVIATTFTACAARTSYQVLSFFFDGVPDPDKVVTAQAGNGNGNAAQKQTTKYLGHGPFEAKMCNACHVKGSNALVKPIQELCLMCHQLDIKKKYVHGPVAVGGCRVCHDPHGSGRAYLLVSQSQGFCFYCHNEQSVSRNPVHQGVTGSCTLCHDAHGSNEKYLLK